MEETASERGGNNLERFKDIYLRSMARILALALTVVVLALAVLYVALTVLYVTLPVLFVALTVLYVPCSLGRRRCTCWRKLLKHTAGEFSVFYSIRRPNLNYYALTDP